MDNQTTSTSWPRLAVLAGIGLVLVGIGWLAYLATKTSESASETTTQTTATAEVPTPSTVETAETVVSTPPPTAPPSTAAPRVQQLTDTDLGSGSAEFSGIALNEASNRIMIADDEGRLFEYDLAADGTPIEPPRRTLRVATGAGDIEGIAWMFDTTYVLAHENDGQLTVVEIGDETTTVGDEQVLRTIDTGVREVEGNGLEGVAFVGLISSEIEFVVVDERPATLVLISADGTVASTVELDLPDASDVWASGPSSFTVISDEARAVVDLQLDADGNVEVINRLSLTLPDGRFEQPEGVVRDRAETRLYVVGEVPGAGQYSFGLWTTADG